jgi:hypothetical protein
MVAQHPSPQLAQIDTHNPPAGPVFDSPSECDPIYPSKAERDRVELEGLQKLFDINMHHSVKPVCHDKTHVLLLSWEAACDDLKTGDEVLYLVETCQGGFLTERR